MKTVPRSCPVCASPGSRDVLYRQRFHAGPLGDGYDVVLCGNCGAGFADGVRTQAELDAYYAGQSKYTYNHTAGVESPYDYGRFETIADQLEARLPARSARILDIGCATGGLLAVLQRRGYTRLHGSDPSPACAETARRLHRLEVRVAALAQHATWTERFDAVLLVGVLEHLREVRPALRVVTGLLNPGGLVYCAQPDVEGFAACDNAPYQQFSLEHVNYFSRSSLVRLMAEENLAAREVWQWMVEWREGATDSVVSGIFQPERCVGSRPRDEVTRPALERYLAKCGGDEMKLLETVERLVATQEPILIWGAGTQTRRLLMSTSLPRANIVAFVDRNPGYSADTLAGKTVLAPPAVIGRGEKIVICSRAFRAEIFTMIRQELRLPNDIEFL